MPTPTPFPSTAWQASLLPASFRGVPFGVEGERGSTGRRGKLHEYPFRDIPNAEDLGRRARRYQIAAFVLGDDAAAQRDQLLAACEQKGPGILIHPTLGVINVQVDPDSPIEWELRLDEGRSIEIRLVFVEPGQVLYPSNGADTQAATNTAADAATGAAAQDAAATMSQNAFPDTGNPAAPSAAAATATGVDQTVAISAEAYQSMQDQFDTVANAYQSAPASSTATPDDAFASGMAAGAGF